MRGDHSNERKNDGKDGENSTESLIFFFAAIKARPIEINEHRRTRVFTSSDNWSTSRDNGFRVRIFHVSVFNQSPQYRWLRDIAGEKECEQRFYRKR